MDRNGPDYLLEKTEKSLRESDDLCREWHGVDNGRLLYAFAPRFAPMCSAELMAATATLARQREAYIQTHLAESAAEIQWVRELFPEARNYTEVYSQRGLLGPKTVLAHCVHLSEEERTVLSAAASGLSHCPTADLFLGNGVMPLRECLDSGLRVGLGSDVGAGPTLCPFDLIRSTIYSAGIRHTLTGVLKGGVSPTTAFYLATLGGAKALSLDNKTGSLDVGKEADFVVINPRRLRSLPGESESVDGASFLSRLLFLADPRFIERTYVRGRICYERNAPREWEPEVTAQGGREFSKRSPRRLSKGVRATTKGE